MNNGESLAFAVQLSGPVTEARQRSASPERLLLVLVVVVLVTLTVIFGAAPGSSEVASLGDPAFGALSSFERAVDDPANGAWSSGEAEWFGCNGNSIPALLCSAETFRFTP